ncbi:MAG: hypothetical protein QOG23_5715 [Blastocatellia bacterium]|nr:hypothetical protein [Blastocatellia bacterium]
MALSMTSAPSANQWLAHPRPNPEAKLRLFCFPYAGGGTTSFQFWSKSLPRTIEVCPVQLAGRGNRVRESPAMRLLPLVEDLAAGLVPFLDKPFAFFGHSMGAMIAFELTRFLRREGEALPAHLFLSGSSAPQYPVPKRHIYDLPERELLEELRRLNGTPKEVLDNPELMQLMLPIIRADFAVCQTYIAPEELPLDCPVTVFGGLQDVDVTREGLSAWREQTTGAFSLWMLQGDHFFLHTSQGKLHEVISQVLHRIEGRFTAGAGAA